MTAADRREELEALLWRVPGIGPPGVDAALAAAAAYATARGLERAAARTPGGKPAATEWKPPAVHFEAPGCRAACRPGDMPVPGWSRTMTPAEVTCGHCRKVIAVVHYAPAGKAACRPRDRVLTGLATPAAAGVTCDRCRKTPAWAAAAEDGEGQ